MSKICCNGVIRDMTEEEQKIYDNAIAQVVIEQQATEE